MINLAGRDSTEVDKEVREELLMAKIPAFDVEPSTGEVKYSVVGRLGTFEFTRAWYYWSVTGEVPYPVAEELYKDPIGARYVRVEGHCDCPHPREWVYPPEALEDAFRIELGLPILDEEEISLKDMLFDYDNWVKRYKGLEDKLTEIRTSGDILSWSISSYHIDSLAGLRLFSDIIREYNLASG